MCDTNKIVTKMDVIIKKGYSVFMYGTITKTTERHGGRNKFLKKED
jgi:hypothetical protein